MENNNGSLITGTEPTLTQGKADLILQSEPTHNDYLMQVKMNEYTVARNAAYEVGGAAVPEPSTIAVSIAGVAMLAVRRLRKRRV